ncbi:MAG: hypothetical protein PHC61_12670 [Chitinivibrionales bacterium]|nr:hypothetical protein [Chitinivibrionales bacterium]
MQKGPTIFRSSKNKITGVSAKRGSVLVTALFFLVIVVIIASVYLTRIQLLNKPLLSQANTLQALFTARAGAYHALDSLENLAHPPPGQVLKTINTLDSAFGKKLFDSAAAASLTGANDADTAAPFNPFSSDSFGECRLQENYSGPFFMVQARGDFRQARRAVRARLGSKGRAYGDTVLFCETAGLPQGGSIDGMVRAGLSGNAVDSLKKLVPKAADALLAAYQKELDTLSNDSLFKAKPCIVRSGAEAEKLDSVVPGPLLVDGSFYEIDWTQKRRMLVLGDLQCTGASLIQGIDFIVDGDIKILDKTALKDVSLYAAGGIFMGDYAVAQRVTMIGRGAISVYGNAQVNDKCILVAIGRPKKNKNAPVAKPAPFACYFAGSSIVDATVVVMNLTSGIKTEKSTKCRGVFWCLGPVCIQGALAGVVRANKLVACGVPPGTPDSVAVFAADNKLQGSIKRLADVGKYVMPYGLGPPAVIDWYEE